MGWENYVFAAFIFALLALLAFMVVKALRKNSDEDSLYKMEREQRMLALYAKMDELADAIEEYVEESKREIDEKLLRIDTLIHEFEEREHMEIMSLVEKMSVDRPAVQPEPVIEETAPEEEQTTIGDMREEIFRMSDEGMSADEIAEALGYSKGEIGFMLRLKPKS